MEAVSTAETPVNIYRISRRNIPQDIISPASDVPPNF
jgi:hypothetical protein